MSLVAFLVSSIERGGKFTETGPFAQLHSIFSGSSDFPVQTITG